MTAEFVALFVLFLVFAVPASIYDWRHFRIPLWYVALGIVALLAFHLCNPWRAGGLSFSALKNPLAAVAGAVLVYGGARVLTGGALGWGDVIFGAFSALFTGFPLVFFATAFSALCGMLFYLALSVRDSHQKKQRFVFRPIFAIPYVPFISFGAVLAVVLFRFFF